MIYPFVSEDEENPFATELVSGNFIRASLLQR